MDYLVKIRSVQTPLNGQFSIGANSQAAISDFIYNLGLGNYNKSTLKLRVGQSNWISAATEIKKWNKAGGVVLKGLTIRRNKEAVLLLA